MKLSTDKVKHVAKLANLPLSEKELNTYSEQLSKILDYIDQLENIDTKKVEPTFNVTGKQNVTRDDSVSKSLTQEEALVNAPSKKSGHFVTKGVFNEQ